MAAAHLPLEASMFLAIVPVTVTPQQLSRILPGAILISVAGSTEHVHILQAQTTEPILGYAFEPAARESRALTDTRALLTALVTGLAAATLRRWRGIAARTLEDRRALLLIVPVVLPPSADAALQAWHTVQRSQAVAAVML